MEIFVVQFRHHCGSTGRTLPSERRYSASTALGLGLLHLLLGGLAFLFGFLAVFQEPHANRWAPGLWLGLIFLATGCLGLMAWKKWYLNSPIGFFLAAAVTSTFAAILCVALPIVGLAQMQPFQQGGDYAEAKVGYALTANLILVGLMELVCSVCSVAFAWKGLRAPEDGAPSKPPMASESYHLRPQMIPDILYHAGNRHHCRHPFPILRLSPLWLQQTGGDLPSLSTMGCEERVQAFLKQAVEEEASETATCVKGGSEDEEAVTPETDTVKAA